MIIKVCGMREEENIAALAKLNVYFMGMIFYEKSPRFVGDKSPFNTELNKIGVFVNATPEYILSMVVKHRLYGVQLHGDENPEYVKELRTLMSENEVKDLFISKAFRMSKGVTKEEIEAYHDLVDLYVLDSGGKAYGGTGEKWDYEKLKELNLNKNFLLSGGINEEDKLNEIVKIHPYCLGVDINSGFELGPGIKDNTKIKRFIDNGKVFS